MKSPMHDTSIFDGTGFESLHNDLQESGVAIASTTDELSRLEQERLEGIFPQIDYTSPATIGVTKYIAWGSNMINIVSRLASDNNAPISTRETFRTIRDNL